VEESWCHTASYTCAVAAIAALRGEDISWLPAAVADALASEFPLVRKEERFLVARYPGYAGYCERTRYRLVPFVY